VSETRIDRRFAALKKEGRAGLVAYVMAGDPDLETSFEIFKGLPAAGVDVIELGMCFTDPMADGPTIQVAGQRALRAGMTLRKTLELVRRFRKEDDDTPIVLMGYYNPIYSYGNEAFLKDAREAGLDGLIIVDLPPEEDSGAAVCRRRAGRLADPAGNAHDRWQASAGRAAEHFRLCLLCLGCRDYRGGPYGYRCRGGGGGAAETPYRSAGRGRLRHQDAGGGGGGCAGRGWCRGRFGHCGTAGRRAVAATGAGVRQGPGRRGASGLISRKSDKMVK